MSGTQTTAARKPRTRKPAEPETPVLAAWLAFEQQIQQANAELDARLTAAREAQAAVSGPVPRFWTQPDLEALRRIDADAAELAADAIAEAGEKADAGHRAVHSGSSLAHPLRYDGGAYEAAHRGEMTGCGDTPALPFRRPQATIPVTDARGAATPGSRDEEMERHFAKFEAAHKEDSAGPASADDPEAGPAVPDERQDGPALDKGPVIVINSDPLRIGEWKKPGSEDRTQP